MFVKYFYYSQISDLQFLERFRANPLCRSKNSFSFIPQAFLKSQAFFTFAAHQIIPIPDRVQMSSFWPTYTRSGVFSFSFFQTGSRM